MKVKSEREVTQSCPTLSDPWTAAYQAPPSMGFSRQEYWSGVPSPSSPITSWQIKEEKVEAVTNFFFLDSKITADADCSQEIRRQLFLGRKAMVNLDSVLKSKDTLPTMVHIVKAMIFPSFMYECESWTQRRQSVKELMPLNCGAREDS